jgi:hypothetical protein
VTGEKSDSGKSIYTAIPPAEALTEGWREHFRPLATQAVQTSWGLPKAQRYVLGLCVQLHAAEEELAALRPLADEVRERDATIQGLRLTLARYKGKEK